MEVGAEELWPEIVLWVPNSCLAGRDGFKQETANNSKSRQGSICRKAMHSERTERAGQLKPSAPIFGSLEDLYL